MNVNFLPHRLWKTSELIAIKELEGGVKLAENEKG
jgi:hypothetical protein